VNVPHATGTVYLGSTFKITVDQVDAYPVIAKHLENLFTTSKRAGLDVTGDWPGAIRYFKTMPHRLETSLSNANEVVATMYYHDVQSVWEAQSLNWDALSAEYLAWKIKNKLDTRTLIATRAALDSLGFDGGAFEIVIGVTALSDSGEEYMLVHEFGSRDEMIPARGLFSPILETNADRYARVVSSAISSALDGHVWGVSGQLAGVTA
jgi:hypothetical protein